jgi:CheY-like chemotaxis protein
VLAILDCVVPGLTGIDVRRELRTRRQTAGIYVILLTARNSAADIVAGLRAGADDYVTKPVLAEELRARVQLGCRIIELRAALKTEVGALAVALASEKLLLKPAGIDSAPHATARTEKTRGRAGVGVSIGLGVDARTGTRTKHPGLGCPVSASASQILQCPWQCPDRLFR